MGTNKRDSVRRNNLEVIHNGVRLKKIFMTNDTERPKSEIVELPAWEFLRNIPSCPAISGHEVFSMQEGLDFYKKHYGDVYGDFRMINIAARLGTYPKSYDDFIYVHRDLWLVLRNAVTRNEQPNYTHFNPVAGKYQVSKSKVVSETSFFKDKHDAHDHGVKSLVDYILQYVKNSPHEHTNKKLNELVDHMIHKMLNEEYWTTTLTSWYTIDKANF